MDINIKQIILKITLNHKKNRLFALLKISAPVILTNRLKKDIIDLEGGILKVKGLNLYEKVVPVSFKIKKGRRGVSFYEFVINKKGEIVYYFPFGKYGAFLKGNKL